jgi:hypothetical protein
MKSSNFPAFASLVFCLFLFNCSSSSAQNPNSQKTKWEVVNRSLTDLLNDGWRLVNQSSDRAAIATAGGVGAFDEQTHHFLLLKNGKYITCIISNPRVIEGAYSKCRALN